MLVKTCYTWNISHYIQLKALPGWETPPPPPPTDSPSSPPFRQSLWQTKAKKLHHPVHAKRLFHRSAQHWKHEVGHLFVCYVFALEMSGRYLKIMISHAQKSVKFWSVFIFLWECQFNSLFLAQWEFSFDSTASYPQYELFQQNKTSFQRRQLLLDAFSGLFWHL